MAMELDEDFVIQDPPEDEEEDEDESEDEVDDEESDDERQEGVLEGGVAEPLEPGKPRRNASLADITFYLTCTENLPCFKNHPILKIGVTVQIGLSKACKLSQVFNRYIEFCNENSAGADRVELSDLEFVHSQVLNGSDTAEAAALMKNDRISVRRERSGKRKIEEARQRLQRETDKEYFNQLRQFLPTQTSSGRTSPHFVHKYADTVLDCQGALPDVHGDDDDDPPVSEGSTVQCHSFIIAKRCLWLGRIISAARQEHARRSVVTLPENEEDEADFDMLQFKMHPHEGEKDPAAAKIENDDEEQGVARARRNSGITEDDISIDADRNSNLLCVTIEKHSAEAVKLLLEYCYTNRVVPLGYHAFIDSCKTKPQHKKQAGPVAPFSNRPIRWPKIGEPTVSFAVALAGIQLAEEASMPRLSFMCEVAASRLVDDGCAVDALLACEEQRKRSDNPLPRLRKAAMDIVLQRLPNTELSVILKSTLNDDKGALLIPSLLMGTMEAVKAGEKKKKTNHHGRSSEERDWQTVAYSSFAKYDRIDAVDRDRERRKRRRGDDSSDASSDLLDADDAEFFPNWREEDSAKQISLKRMSHHNIGGRLSARLTNNKMSRRSSTTSSKAHKRSLR